LNSFLSLNIENGTSKVEAMPPSTHPKLKPAVLLCIDDDEDVLECEKSFLESFGYTVLTAATGSTGLELASMHSVDLVIVDYVMPEMNGHEVAKAMRRLRPQAPIIMLSGAVDVPEQALKWVDAFIAKDRLASQLLPAITQLRGCECLPPQSYEA
jgi:CheY-like chemotaxis protein